MVRNPPPPNVPPGTTIIDATHIGDQVLEEADQAPERFHDENHYHAPSAVGKTTADNLRPASYRGRRFLVDSLHSDGDLLGSREWLAAQPNEVERSNGYVRPLRSACLHSCGQFVTLSVDAARALATDPHCFDHLTCPKCKGLRPVGEFTWVGAPDQVVGL